MGSKGGFPESRVQEIKYLYYSDKDTFPWKANKQTNNKTQLFLKTWIGFHFSRSDWVSSFVFSAPRTTALKESAHSSERNEKGILGDINVRTILGDRSQLSADKALPRICRGAWKEGAVARRGSCRQSPGQEWVGSKERLWRCVLWISLPTAACFHCCFPPWPSILPAGSNGNSPFRKWIKQPEEKVRMGELRLVHPNSEFGLSYHPSSQSGQINRQAVPQTQNSYYFPMVGWESWKETVVGKPTSKKLSQKINKIIEPSLGEGGDWLGEARLREWKGTRTCHPKMCHFDIRIILSRRQLRNNRCRKSSLPSASA